MIDGALIHIAPNLLVSRVGNVQISHIAFQIWFVLGEHMEDLKQKKLCADCIRETFLSAEVSQSGHLMKCSFCGNTAKALSLERFAGYIATAFEQHYRLTSDQPTDWESSMHRDTESDYNWERSGEPIVEIIADIAKVSEVVAVEVQRILESEHGDFEAAKSGEETEFCDSSHYERIGANDLAWQCEWDDFEQSLKSEARFFNQIAMSHLARIFDGVECLHAKDGRALIVEIGPGQDLNFAYRARVFQSDAPLKEALCRPDRHLGPPSMHHAIAGRMNARGISVFYGASDIETAISEVRPPVGSQVAIARFDIVRPLRVLDLDALRETYVKGSVFDSELVQQLERAAFLQTLSKKITRPVMPDDEALDYLTTQAIADFLATEGKSPLDGIIFPSVQAGGEGKNIVLFHKAARVADMSVPDGVIVSASISRYTYEEADISYTILETSEMSVQKQENDYSPELEVYASDRDPYDARESSLEVLLDSVVVHNIERVSFKSTSSKVERCRFSLRDNEL